MSARSSACRGAPGRASGRRWWRRPRRGPGHAAVRRAVPSSAPASIRGDEAGRPPPRGRPRTRSPSATTAAAPEWAGRAPPRPGPGGGSWARPRRRPGGRRSTRPATAARARAAGGCRRGAGLEAWLEQAAGQGVGGAVPLGERHGADVDDLERGPVAEFGGHAAQVLVHQHGAVPQGARWSERKVDAGVRFVAAWPMRLRGSIRDRSWNRLRRGADEREEAP